MATPEKGRATEAPRPHDPHRPHQPDITYGPWKNIFYACYFITTGVHGLHVVGGIIALVLCGPRVRGKFSRHTEYVGLYWHFVDLVWIFLFPLLYCISDQIRHLRLKDSHERSYRCPRQPRT